MEKNEKKRYKFLSRNPRVLFGEGHGSRAPVFLDGDHVGTYCSMPMLIGIWLGSDSPEVAASVAAAVPSCGVFWYPPGRRESHKWMGDCWSAHAEYI